MSAGARLGGRLRTRVRVRASAGARVSARARLGLGWAAVRHRPLERLVVGVEDLDVRLAVGRDGDLLN